MVKVKIEPGLFDRAKLRGGSRRLQQRRGVHRQLHREGDPAAQDRGATKSQVSDQLRGLGYIE